MSGMTPADFAEVGARNSAEVLELLQAIATLTLDQRADLQAAFADRDETAIAEVDAARNAGWRSAVRDLVAWRSRTWGGRQLNAAATTSSETASAAGQI